MERRSGVFLASTSEPTTIAIPMTTPRMMTPRTAGDPITTADNHLQQPSPVAEGGAGGGGSGSSLHLEPGWFAVFPLELSNPCSLVVGKIVSINLSRGNEGEITVHWYTPARKGKSRRAKYGRGVWSQEFVLDGNRRIPDEGTESVDSACFTFPSLLQSGKLPTAVWAAVEDSVPTSSLEEEDSDRESEK